MKDPEISSALAFASAMGYEVTTEGRLKAKYPHSNHGPDPTCNHCEGKGEKPVLLPDGVTIMTGCICIYVSHENVAAAQEAVSSVVRRMKEELK